MANTYAYITRKTSLVSKKKGFTEQHRLIEGYCHEHNLSLSDTYEDFSCSSNTSLFSRPRFRELVKSLCAGDSIIVTRTDILSADTLPLQLCARLFEKMGVRLISLAGLSNTPFESTSENRRVHGVISDYEHLVTAQRFSRGRVKKTAAGEKAGGAAPLGYLWDEYGKITIDIENKDLVGKIFDYYLSYGSISKVKQQLDHEGVLTPRGNAFSKEALRVILTNEFYIGTVRNGKHSEQGTHERLIADRIFSQVEAQLQQNRRNKT